MNGDQLRERLDALDLPYEKLALMLGLSVRSLHRQMRGEAPVSRQTEIILEEVVEKRLKRRPPLLHEERNAHARYGPNNLAKTQVRDAEDRVSQQLQLISSLERGGFHDAAGRARELLGSLNDTLQIARRNLDIERRSLRGGRISRT